MRDGGDADVVVVGSGAAGAILAYRLAEAGRRVLVLERGPHVDPRDFVEDEVAMYLKLYNEGALQVARDFRFQVLQGMCVGGSTVVNNAVCFDPPPDVLDALGARHRPRPRRRRAGDRRGAPMAADLARRPARRQPGRRAVRPRRRGGSGSGARSAGSTSTSQDCFGCGYCNIGCAFGRKLSMLDTVLPEGQARFGDRLRVLADCRATGIEHDGRGRATAVHAELGGRALRIAADTVVVAAGAVGSSWLLLDAAGSAGRRSGTELYFNMTSPLTADFEAVMDAHHGLQMSHALRAAGRGAAS